MPKKKENVITKSNTGLIKSAKIDFGRLKTRKKGDWRRRKTREGKDSAYVEKSEVLEDNEGRKYVRNKMTNADRDDHGLMGASYDWQTAKNHRRGIFDQAGKGDAPRNMGKKFHSNYNEIDWGSEKETTKQGLPMPKKFKKVYK